MYDLDGNGELDVYEMTKIIEDIYAMQRVYSKLGANNEKPTKTAEEMAKGHFLSKNCVASKRPKILQKLDFFSISMMSKSCFRVFQLYMYVVVY